MFRINHHRMTATLMVTLFAALCTVSLSPSSAEAFCGFYVSGAEGKLFNDATTVVMMREGQRTVLSMQNNYKGPPENFAMVVPVPIVLQKENVKTLANSVFDDVDRMAAPRLVEYWEQDPCFQPTYDEYESVLGGMDVNRMPSVAESASEAPKVVVEAQFKVGEYEIVVLSASESTALDRWLRQNNYNIPKGAESVMQPYIEKGMYFFVAKVDLDKVAYADGRAALSPLRFHYDSEEFALPVRLGLLNAQGTQDLIVHILAKGQRYEAANLKNVTIPTNLEVADEVRTRFGEFYAALLDKTLEKTPGAMVTEYSWDASTCDPCPGPTLTQNHFSLLGADTMPNAQPWGYVLTRLHLRYTKESLTDDIVFKPAAPVVGGREFTASAHQLEQGATPSSVDNFQGRYIIRHPWTGAVMCDEPRRGVWGGPPSGDPPGVTAAQNTAFAPRGELELTRVLRSPAPEIGLDQATLVPVDEVAPFVPGNDRLSSGCGACATAVNPRTPVFGALLAALGAFGILVFRRR